MSNFDKFFVNGGYLVWLILAPLSLLTLQQIVSLWLDVRRYTVAGDSESISGGAKKKKASGATTTVTSILDSTLEIGKQVKSKGRVVAEDAMSTFLQDHADTMSRRLERLNLIGAVAPMVGLFGTVWGMINAFFGIVEVGGQPEPVDLADGIGMALITTWWGLIVAIPALAAAGLLRASLESRFKRLTQAAEQWLDKNLPR